VSQKADALVSVSALPLNRRSGRGAQPFRRWRTGTGLPRVV